MGQHPFLNLRVNPVLDIGLAATLFPQALNAAFLVGLLDVVEVLPAYLLRLRLLMLTRSQPAGVQTPSAAFFSSPLGYRSFTFGALSWL